MSISLGFSNQSSGASLPVKRGIVELEYCDYSMLEIVELSENFSKHLVFGLEGEMLKILKQIVSIQKYALTNCQQALVSVRVSERDQISNLRFFQRARILAVVFDVAKIIESTEAPVQMCRQSIKNSMLETQPWLHCVIDCEDAHYFWQSAGVPRYRSVEDLGDGGLERVILHSLNRA